MTGVDKDLATLRGARYRCPARHSTIAQHEACPACAAEREIKDALDRVEAELSRLREQRDALDRERDAGWRTMVEQRERAEAAEARCARLQQALAKADKAASKAHDAMWAMDFDKTAASSLERDEWKRLRERASKAVWAIHNLLRPLIDEGESLAGPDTPADSQEDKDVSRAWLKIIEAVESRGYTVHDLEWEPWGQAAEKEGIPGGWSLRVEPDPSPPGSTGYDWFGGLSWQEVVENIERWLPERADSQEGE